jgi:hypothetical protein
MSVSRYSLHVHGDVCERLSHFHLFCITPRIFIMLFYASPTLKACFCIIKCSP